MTAPIGSTNWVTAACSLPSADRPLRLAEFDELFAAAVLGAHRSGPTHLQLTLAAAPGRADQVRDLTAREAECCSFFTFRLEDGDPLRLHVTLPAAHTDVLDALAERASRLARGAA